MDRTSVRRWSTLLPVAPMASLVLAAAPANPLRAQPGQSAAPRADLSSFAPPPAELIDIGGQRIHLHCEGTAAAGAPTVILESGAGDFSMVWALVQPKVAEFSRVCAYDRGGYGWSEPGHGPRTYAQLTLELHRALEVAHIAPPYILVGQSYGGLLARAFAAHYRPQVVGMVLVDATHEDERIEIEGSPVRIREWARWREAPEPRIARDDTLGAKFALASDSIAPLLDYPLDRLPENTQRMWRWAAARPTYRAAWNAEMDWSPEEMARLHEQRLSNHNPLGELPLVVLARTPLLTDSLDAEHLRLQRDLAALSVCGGVIVAHDAGHNIHLEEPALVVRAIKLVVQRVGHRAHGESEPCMMSHGTISSSKTARSR